MYMLSPSQKVLFKMIRQLNTEASVTGKPSPLIALYTPVAASPAVAGLHRNKLGELAGPPGVCLPKPVSSEGDL